MGFLEEGSYPAVHCTRCMPTGHSVRFWCQGSCNVQITRIKQLWGADFSLRDGKQSFNVRGKHAESRNQLSLTFKVGQKIELLTAEADNLTVLVFNQTFICGRLEELLCAGSVGGCLVGILHSWKIYIDLEHALTHSTTIIWRALWSTKNFGKFLGQRWYLCFPVSLSVCLRGLFSFCNLMNNRGQFRNFQRGGVGFNLRDSSVHILLL